MTEQFKIPTTPSEIVWVAGNVPPASDPRWPAFSVVLTWQDGGPPNTPITILRFANDEGNSDEYTWVFDDDFLNDQAMDQEKICESDWWAVVGVFDTEIEELGPDVH
jgi:hypothetical protein